MKRLNSGNLPTIHLKSSNSRKDSSRLAVKPHYKAQEKLKVFVEDLNDHVKWLLNRKQFLLQGRHYQVLQQLMETKKALEVYEKGVRNLERQIEDDPKIRTMKSQLKFYDEYSNILRTLYSGIDEEIREEKQKIIENKRILAEKKRTLNAKNHENIQLASQITKLRDILNNLSSSNHEKALPIEFSKDSSIVSTVKQFAKFNTSVNHNEENGDNNERAEDREAKRDTYNEQSQSGDVSSSELRDRASVGNSHNEYILLRKQTETLVRRSNGLKKNIIVKINNFNESYDLFLQSFHKYEDALYKSQMVVHNQGLNGSLIFLLLNSKKKSLESMNPGTIKDNRFLGRKDNMVKPFKKQQDGEVIDVIYATFKKMLHREESKNDKVKEMVSSVQYDQLLAFTPMQVMGLILLKPEVLRDVIFEFDEKKKRLIGISMSLKNIKISEIK